MDESSRHETREREDRERSPRSLTHHGDVPAAHASASSESEHPKESVMETFARRWRNADHEDASDKICTRVWEDMGVRREVLRGFTKSSWGSGGRCEPHSGVRGGAPEDFEINAFQRLRTPVSLSFLSQCCYTKIHAIFFIHSHPHHFQLNEVVPNHTL